MLKKMISILILSTLAVGCGIAWGQPVQPAAVAGLVTINGSQVTQANDPGYIFFITRPDGSHFISDNGSIAEDADGLNSSNAYQILIPLYESTEQPKGANPGEAAVIHVSLNNQELTVNSPANGQIKVGEKGSTTRVDISAENSTANNPPTADAGQDQEVTGAAAVTLDGSKSSDPDGDTLTYFWRQTQGDSVTLSNTASPAPSFTAPDPPAAQQVNLVFELKVTDPQNATDTDSVTITVVSSQKIGPIANAGPSQTVQENVPVTLDGSNSTDPDSEGSNGIKSFSWFQTGGTSVSLSPVVDGRTTFNAPEVGPQGESLTFELTVTDKDNLQDTDSTIVNVVSVNKPPVADAGSSQNVQAGDTVTLNGSGSTDPDSDDQGKLSYQWVQTVGTTVSLSNSHISSPTFTAPNTGPNGESLKFELRVTDPGKLTDTDSVTINVVSVNQPPAADAGPDQSVAEGLTVTLNGTNSRDPELGPLIYLWAQLGGSPVTLSNAKSVTPQFTSPSFGLQTLTFELTVIDNKGLQHSDRTRVHITSTGTPPNANAGADQEVTSGDSVILDGTKSKDEDGTIKQYRWVQISGDADVTLSNPASTTPSFTAPQVDSQGDSLRFRLTVTDNDDLTDEDETLVTVKPKTGEVKPPVADTIGSSAEVYEGKTGILNGTGSTAPSGSIVSYQWKQTGGPSVTIADPAADFTTFSAPGVENDATVLTFSLIVTDSNNLKDETGLQIKIRNFGEGAGESNGSCFINTLTGH